MKRSVIIVLIISFVALPLFAAGSKPRCVALEHVRGEWRMQIRCEQGVGAISLSDTSSTKVYAARASSPTGRRTARRDVRLTGPAGRRLGTHAARIKSGG